MASAWPACLGGVLVGVAAAVKLVPGIFVGYFLVTRQWRAAFTAMASTVVCILVAFALAPSSSWTYWTKTLYESNRIGDSRYYSNQSLLGMVQRTVDERWGRSGLAARGRRRDRVGLRAGASGLRRR